jgi:hypothetical protein
MGASTFKSWTAQEAWAWPQTHRHRAIICSVNRGQLGVLGVVRLHTAAH